MSDMEIALQELQEQVGILLSIIGDVQHELSVKDVEMICEQIREINKSLGVIF